MLQRGLLLIGITFSVVGLVLIGQFVDSVVRPIPGLVYLFAACDPPAVLGGCLAALGAMRAAPGTPGAAARAHVSVAAVALVIVATVVLGDFGLARVMKGSALAAALGSKPAWLVADAATVVALGSLGAASKKMVQAAGRSWPGLVTGGLAVLLAIRLAAGVWGAIGEAPAALRLAEAALYAMVAWSCCRAAISVRP